MEINTEIYAQLPPELQGMMEGLRHQLSHTQAELNTYQKRCEQYEQAYEQLQHQLKELLRHRFGTKSERFIDVNDPQLTLFVPSVPSSSIAPSAESAELKISEEEVDVSAYRRKKKVKNKKNLPTRIEIIPVCDKDKLCVCGEDKLVIRYEIKKLLHYQPPVYEMIEQRREVAACPKGCDKAIITAPLPSHILPKAKVTEEFLSSLIVSKLDDRQPLYHLEKQLNDRYGIECSRQTMARWMIELIEPLQPIINLMKDEIIHYDVSSCDATTLQVLREPGRSAEIKSYVYCMRGGPPDKGVILYDYNYQLHKKFVMDWYEGYAGYLQVDGDNFFELIGARENVTLSHCHAHARRKFESIAQSVKGNSLAKEVLKFYRSLYRIERQAKEEKLNEAQRYELRQQESKPLLNKFKGWLDEKQPTVLPQSPLGKAINYCLKLWPGLIQYLEDGRLAIDNNLTEQEIKPFVMSRKNFLFATSMAGAKALSVHLSLIRTAKQHGHEPYHYYVKLLKGIPHCKFVEDYEKLLPWNINQGEGSC